ncbi:PD-(D/E)XK nuclease family protein [Halomarina oriensis]|uniref:PD-(D/E)XK nuclease family protein n=1 Tax=Halomarina oriensis TaxID=671145 RepID=A0A6B0GM32_9EURY|nr:PD-(D/E)XK nuclease family protein [Halomarina oriensis]
MSKSDDDLFTVSPSRLGVYADCPRRYQYEKVWKVGSPDETRRYLDRGLALHGAIEDTCETVREGAAITDEDIRTMASDAIDARWDEETDRSEYASDAHYRYDYLLCVATIEDYFDGVGLDHARNSIATEEWLECQREGVALRGRADNIVKTAEGIRVIDYKSNLKGIISDYSKDAVVAHHAGDDHSPQRVKSTFQAATYVEGVKEHPEYEPGMDVEFTYYGLLSDTETKPGVDGVQVSVRGRGRDVGQIYDTCYDEIWELIGEYYDAIEAGDYVPDSVALQKEHACDDCTFQAMCPDYLAGEVSVDE